MFGITCFPHMCFAMLRFTASRPLLSARYFGFTATQGKADTCTFYVFARDTVPSAPRGSAPCASFTDAVQKPTAV